MMPHGATQHHNTTAVCRMMPQKFIYKGCIALCCAVRHHNASDMNKSWKLERVTERLQWTMSVHCCPPVVIAWSACEDACTCQLHCPTTADKTVAGIVEPPPTKREKEECNSHWIKWGHDFASAPKWLDTLSKESIDRVLWLANQDSGTWFPGN